MKLNEEYIIYDMGEDRNLVPTGNAADAFHGIVRCNPTAAFIVDCLKADITEEELLNKLKERYEGDVGHMADNLKKTLNTLRSIHALSE